MGKKSSKSTLPLSPCDDENMMMVEVLAKRVLTVKFKPPNPCSAVQHGPYSLVVGCVAMLCLTCLRVRETQLANKSPAAQLSVFTSRPKPLYSSEDYVYETGERVVMVVMVVGGCCHGEVDTKRRGVGTGPGVRSEGQRVKGHSQLDSTQEEARKKKKRNPHEAFMNFRLLGLHGGAVASTFTLHFHHVVLCYACVPFLFLTTRVLLNITMFYNQSGKHVFQQHSGCEWDDETGETKSFNRYAYDGEDFLKLDLLKHEWTALTEKAYATKLTWENNKVSLKHSEYFYSIQCPDWLKKYVTFGREYLQRAVLPLVSLLQRSNSSLVSCHATGFFPDIADLFWMKDGEEFHGDVEKGEILPNNDETFQMSIYLNTSSLPLTDWQKFSCVFQLFSSQKNITVSLDKTKIRTNDATHVMCSGNTGLFNLDKITALMNEDCQQKVICFVIHKCFYLALIEAWSKK
ncbi:uncharacterized protein LOC101175332 [Oryzias latipes]|uniref:uncharacterized protein LOC101175332 n=1 Tax=Oryzias latipes TaxID=8090 RepID=UPI000CE1C1D8|nr:uncharacterized protein LOC101175332 [Oryzias latipes]